MARNEALHHLMLAAAYQRQGDPIRAAKAFTIATGSKDLTTAAKLVASFNAKRVKAAENGLDDDGTVGVELRGEPNDNKTLREVQEADLNEDFIGMGLEDEPEVEQSASEEDEEQDVDGEDEEESKKEESSARRGLKPLSRVELSTVRFRRSLENINAMNEAAAKKKKPLPKKKPLKK